MSTKKTEEIIIPEKISVYEDNRTHARTVAFPFDFPDNTPGMIMVCRLKALPWQPYKTIKKITIHYED